MNHSRLIPFYKIVLSLFVIFQMGAAFVLPNPESILYRKLSFIYEAYGNFFGMNTTWRFFSPNPLVRRVSYEVFSRNSKGALEGHSENYPQRVDQENFRETHNRKFAHGLILITRLDILKNTFAPYICRKHPGAESVAFYAEGRELPTIESAQFFREDRANLGDIQKNYLLDVSCKPEDES